MENNYNLQKVNEEVLKNTFHILVVEDDEINQNVFMAVLKKYGYTFDIANNGIEALELIKEKSFDLCLMDMQMPKMDGIQATQIIRNEEVELGRRLPIIAVTANYSFGERERFFNAGVDEYILKPIHIMELLKGIERFKKNKLLL